MNKKTKSFLSLNCKDEENLEILKNAVRELKWFKEKKLTINSIDSCMKAIRKKYDIYIDYIFLSDSKEYYSATIYNGEKLLYNVYGLTYFEIFLKALLYMYEVINEE